MLFPVTYRVNARGHMEVGGCDLADLAHEHGTPLYIYDEDTVRQRAAEFVAAMGDAGEVLYSAKAFASPAFLRIVAEEGMGLDVVSAGELHIAAAAGFPAERTYFLGNNKSAEELELAYRAGCTIVIDGAYEFELFRRAVPPGSRATSSRPASSTPSSASRSRTARPGPRSSRRSPTTAWSWSASTRTSAPRSSTFAATSRRWR
ncbi:MAG: hypothetical protein E6J29_06910 [Chloroflexi bacterium]|nr:MAG: hypothetical protein E6J29_06910 [Chloroflexota bacterium]